MKTKIAYTGNPEEDLYRTLVQHISRETVRAEADALFGGNAAENRKKDRSALEALFVQTPAAQINTPNLLAEGKEKKSYEIKPEDRPDIPKKDFAQPKKEEAGHKGKYPIPDRQHAKSALGFAKMHGDSEAYAAVRAKVKAKYPDMLQDEKEKSSSIAPAVDAYFEKVAAEYSSSVYGRYPELLKVAQTPTPNMKGRDTKTTTPSRSMVSGGSA